MTCRWNAKLSDSFSDLFGRYVPAHIEGGFVPLYCCYSQHCLVPCGKYLLSCAEISLQQQVNAPFLICIICRLRIYWVIYVQESISIVNACIERIVYEHFTFSSGISSFCKS